MLMIRTLHYLSSRLVIDHSWRKRQGLYWFIVCKIEERTIITLSSIEGEHASILQARLKKVFEIEMEADADRPHGKIESIDTGSLCIIAAGALHVFRTVVELYGADQQYWNYHTLWAPPHLDMSGKNVQLNPHIHPEVETIFWED